MKQVLILGGYGNFGSRISTELAKSGIPIIIAGRSESSAAALSREIRALYPTALIKTAVFDIYSDFNSQLTRLTPYLVINTCGPFQGLDYEVIETCIGHGVHYIDLADGRAYVSHCQALDAQAKAAGVTVITGASTVPALSSAVIEHYRDEFSSIHSLKYGITPGQKTKRGLATTEAVLSYLGKVIPTSDLSQPRYGWQDLYRQDYPELGKRWMSNCDIPDLDLFPKRYGIKRMQFSAGMESTTLHLGMWLAAGLVRLGLPLPLKKHAKKLLKYSCLLDRFGSSDGGMHMILDGYDRYGSPKKIEWFITAKNGQGPFIPITPSVILAKQLLDGAFSECGVQACVGLIPLQSYLSALPAQDTKTHERITSNHDALFKTLLGSDWSNLHPHIQARFQRQPTADHPIQFTGEISKLSTSFMGKVLSLFSRPFVGRALMPYNDEGFPVDVNFAVKPGSSHFYKNRLYKPHHKKPIHFCSYMTTDKKGRLFEQVGRIFSIQFHLFSHKEKLCFKSVGYYLHAGFFKIKIPSFLTPGTILLRHGNISQQTFSLDIDIHHPWFGLCFSQQGTFRDI